MKNLKESSKNLIGTAIVIYNKIMVKYTIGNSKMVADDADLMTGQNLDDDNQYIDKSYNIANLLTMILVVFPLLGWLCRLIL